MSAFNKAARISAAPMMPGSSGSRSSDGRSLTKRDCSHQEIQIPWLSLKIPSVTLYYEGKGIL